MKKNAEFLRKAGRVVDYILFAAIVILILVVAVTLVQDALGQSPLAANQAVGPIRASSGVWVFPAANQAVGPVGVSLHLRAVNQDAGLLIGAPVPASNQSTGRIGK